MCGSYIVLVSVAQMLWWGSASVDTPPTYTRGVYRWLCGMGEMELLVGNLVEVGNWIYSDWYTDSGAN